MVKQVRILPRPLLCRLRRAGAYRLSTPNILTDAYHFVRCLLLFGGADMSYLKNVVRRAAARRRRASRSSVPRRCRTARAATPGRWTTGRGSIASCPRQRGRHVLRDRAGADGGERRGRAALHRGGRPRAVVGASSRSRRRAARRRTIRRSSRWRSPPSTGDVGAGGPRSRRCRASAASARTSSTSRSTWRSSGGWGRGLRARDRGVVRRAGRARLAYQAVKYQPARRLVRTATCCAWRTRRRRTSSTPRSSTG